MSRGASLTASLTAVRLLREKPLRPPELADALGVSLSTAKRILGAIQAAGEPLVVEKVGREARYSIQTKQ